MQKPTAQDTFDAWANSGRAEGMENSHRPRAEQALARIPLKPGDRVLDLGCGNGWATRWLGEAVGENGHALGLDVSEEMVARANTHPEVSPQVSFVQGDFSSLSLEDASMDHAFSMEALYYALNLPQALAEIARVIRRDGTLCVCTDFYVENPHCLDWPEMMGIPMALLSEGDWVAAFGKAGFDSVHTTRCLDPRLDANLDPGERHFREHVGALAILGQRS